MSNTKKPIKKVTRDQERQTKRRPKRNPGSASMNLEVKNMDENYVYYWPLENKVGEFRDSDYELCDSNSDPVDMSSMNEALGSAYVKDGRDGKKHYLMRKRKEWYEQDQAFAQEKITRDESAIYNPGEGLYAKKIEIEHKDDID